MSHKNLGKDKSKAPYTRKTVRISSKNQEKEISPSAKEFNRANTFSKQDRRNTIQTIRNGLDKDFIEYMKLRNESRKGLSVKQYRDNVIRDVKNRAKLMDEIRKTRKISKHSKTPTPPKENIRHTPSRPKKRISPQLVSNNSSNKNTSTTPSTDFMKRLKSMFSLS